MDGIPIEILCKILTYLDTYDLMQFCKAYGSNCFLNEGSVIRSVDFSRRFELKDVNLYITITLNINYAYIKRLNIDYMYWIPPPELRKLIKQLNNLEELHALETSLGFHYKDVEVYDKLKKLAVSLTLREIKRPLREHAVTQTLDALKSLSVRINHKEHDYSFQNLLSNIPNLEEIWICDEDACFHRIGYEEIMRSLKHIKKFVIKSVIPVYCNSFEQYGFTKTFECRRNGPQTELIFEKIKPEYLQSTSNLEQNEVRKSLAMFEVFLHDVPYGPVESRQLCLTNSINNIYFEDLNFCQPIILCHSKYIDAAIQILLSKSSTRLKRLKLRSCLFRISEANIASKPVDHKILKEESSAISPNSFQAISENVKNLTELEIEICPECNDGIVILAYLSIQNFENLHRLSLEVPPSMDGCFLKEVFMKCQHLAYLNLTCVVRNEKFIANLYINLKYTNNLRDFRLNHKYIELDNLLDSLNSINNKKLLRIFINCSVLSRVGCKKTPVYKFVEDNPQVVLFIINKEIKDKRIDKEQEMLLNLMEENIAKTYWINSRVIKLQMCTAHRDICFNSCNISAINIDKF